MNSLRKSIIKSLVVSCLIVSFILSSTSVFADAALIKDLDKSSSYAKQAISDLAGAGILTGDNFGNFNPQDTITRAQMITMLARILKLDIKNLPAKATFKDVPKNHWAFPYVEAAYKSGIVTGVSKDNFGVNEINTREQMAAMFVRSLGITDGDMKKISGTENIDKLADKGNIAGWAKGYVEFALSAGLMNGTSSKTFGPKESAKREQAAVVTHRFINSGDKELTNDELAALEKSVVIVESYDNEGNIKAQGSGFSIGKGLFMTLYPVIQGSRKHIITDNMGNRHEVQGIVRYDADLDLAIIKTVEPINIAPLQIGSISNIQKSDKIVTISRPQGLQNTISEGIIAGINNLEYGDTGKVDLVQITAPLSDGSIGGALFDMRGNVIGVTTLLSEGDNLKCAISIDHVKGWIQELTSKPFDSITVLDMSKVIEAYLDNSDESIKAVFSKAFQAMEERDLDAYMETVHKFNPTYRETKEALTEIFQFAEFDYNILDVKIWKNQMDMLMLM